MKRKLFPIFHPIVLGSIFLFLQYPATRNSSAAELAMSRPDWPDLLKINQGDAAKAKFHPELSQPGRFVYRSRHFQITLIGDFPIIDWQSEEIATLLEATYQLLRQSPLGVQASPVDGYYQAEFYQSEKAYRLASGRKMGTGVYLRSKKKFMAPVNLKKVLPTPPEYKELGEKFMTITYHKRTLVHEVTHMMMHDILPMIPIWCIEGSAEYVEQLPRDSYAYMPDRAMAGVSYIAKKYRLKAAGAPAISFEELLSMDSQSWASYINSTDRNQSNLYFKSFLTVSYFMLEKPDLFFRYLQGCRAGARIQKKPHESFLWEGLTAREVGMSIEKWLDQNQIAWQMQSSEG